jgi:hypothetical protein
MKKKPKIAFCISGLTKSSMLCYPYIYDALLNYPELDIDVFSFTWEENPRVLDLYRPKEKVVETINWKTIVSHLKRNLEIKQGTIFQGNPDNILAEYYGLYKVFQLVDDSYDYVIRCRFDVIIQDKFDMRPIIEKLENDEFDIFFPDEVFNFGGYQNRIFIGKYWAMKHAMNIISKVNLACNVLGRFHPESFLKWVLDEENVRTYQTDINHRIIRKSFVEANWPENPFKFKDL